MKSKLLNVMLLLMSFPTINSQTMVNINTDTSIAPIEKLKFTHEWDKIFPKSDKVDHKKVTFINRYGITLAADMFIPMNVIGKLPAIAISGPFEAVTFKRLRETTRKC